MTEQVIKVPTVIAVRPVQDAVRRVNANFTELYDEIVGASTDSLTLIQKADGKWYEISRSVN